ncbi:hypothetical protein K461DRAFT_276826 [Myriangium duriaei CBS 260.36]|uniref:Uncharacterized protein n=1 Tax=Myriangium duriaei CBS 260.36 TaxID=1168546 RepID=A0A9P4J2Y1_9PEZI|nr:hypothetical protein K461DRAFT_276826 [Myriangium duriaei CBS 260.36]
MARPPPRSLPFPSFPCPSQRLLTLPETSEGLDKLFSLLYYSRIRFVHQLLPFLTATPLPSTRVISIYAAGLEDPHKNFFPDDLSLRDTRNFSYTATRNHVVHMKTMAFETIAQQYPNVGLVHVFPGLVITPGFDRNPLPWWFRVLWTIFRPIAGWFALKHEDSGEWTLGLTSDRFGRAGQSKAGGEAAAESTDGVVGGGAYSAKYNGQVYGNIAVYEGLRKKGFREKVWEHTMSAFKEISEGRVFKD